MTAILLDDYNRKIDYLRISVTDRCNMRCIYCMPEQGIQCMDHQQILTYEEYLKIIDIALSLGFSSFRFTGGEPLVRKGFPELIKQTSLKNGVRDVALTTNGLLLKQYAVLLKENGLKRVNISIDSLNSENFARITRRDVLEEVLSGIDAALEAGLDPVKINTVIMPENIDEIYDFAKMTLSKPLHIRFIEFMPMGDKLAWDSRGYFSTTYIKGLLEKRFGFLECVERAYGAGPAVYYKIKDSLGTIGFISPMSSHFCHECNRLRLTSDGKLRACLTLNAEIDIKTLLSAGCTDDELREAFRRIIMMKPDKHVLGCISNEYSKRRMSEIGG